jgi:predicted ArsR family transcriptional regulator
MYENTPPAVPVEVLGHPVRAAIVSRLMSHDDASLDELAEHADVHRNTVRTHAAFLERRGWLERARPAPGSGRGRPRTRYRLAAGTDHPFADFRNVSQLLAGALSAAGVSPPTARRLGRELARSSVQRRVSTPWSTQLEHALGLLGFAATVEEGSVLLRRCPCPVASPGAPALVCNLVSGFADGVLESLAAKHRVSSGESAHDPDRQRCVLALTHRHPAT